MQVIVLLHAFATLSMVGVIWFVQIVHYPLMGNVGASEFPSYEREHQRRTSLVVGPLMLVEAVTAMLLLVIPSFLPIQLACLGALLLAALWASTFFWQVPCHARLSESFDATTHQRLVQSNWLRTLLWSIRGALAVWICICPL